MSNYTYNPPTITISPTSTFGTTYTIHPATGSGTVSIGAVGGTGGGGVGQVYTGTGWQTASNITMSTSILSIQAQDGGDAYIKTSKNKINLDEMASVVETLKERMLILTPDFEKHERYPALKEAYDNYKALEALLSHTDSDK